MIDWGHRGLAVIAAFLALLVEFDGCDQGFGPGFETDDSGHYRRETTWRIRFLLHPNEDSAKQSRSHQEHINVGLAH